MTQGGFRLARLFGIEVRVDWSLAVVFWLIAFNLGAGLLPLRHPGWPPVALWSLAVLAAALFFASILAHELGHALVARGFGLAVEGITLFIFGGVSRILEEPRSARAEFLVAAVGPLVSLVIGVGCLLGGQALGGGASTVLLWLGSINVLLAIFNLLPGFPLDGGRVLRSAIWRATGDLDRATRAASVVGRAIAIALVAAGMAMAVGLRVPLLGRGLVGGLWLVLIGWFLHGAAVQSQRQVRVQALLRGIPVGRLMRSASEALAPDLPVDRFVDRYLATGADHGFPVVAGETLLGLVSLAEVRGLPRAEWARRSVADIMLPADTLSVLSPDDPASEALRRLAARGADEAPVLERGHLLGLLRRRDVLRWAELQGA